MSDNSTYSRLNFPDTPSVRVVEPREDPDFEDLQSQTKDDPIRKKPHKSDSESVYGGRAAAWRLYCFGFWCICQVSITVAC